MCFADNFQLETHLGSILLYVSELQANLDLTSCPFQDAPKATAMPIPSMVEAIQGIRFKQDVDRASSECDGAITFEFWCFLGGLTTLPKKPFFSYRIYSPDLSASPGYFTYHKKNF